MKTKIYLLVIFISLSHLLKAQTGPGPVTPTNFIPNCSCITFVESCSGNVLTSLAGTLISFSCDGEKAVSLPISSTGEICIPSYLRKCTSSSICINKDNWEVCKVVGCTVYLSQSIPTNPTVNGTLIGYGTGTPGTQATQTYCGRKGHTGALNLLAGSTPLSICPGDPFILNIPGMSLTGGMCLTVTIRYPSGAALYSQTFNASNTSGSSVDLTSIFGAFQSLGTTWRIDMRLHCCSGTTDCTFNSFKYAFVTIEGKFSYKPYITTQGNIFNNPPPISFIPPKTPHGYQLPGTATNQSITFTGYDVVNPNGVNVTFTVFRTFCDNNPNNDQSFLGPATIAANNPFTTGLFPLSGSTACNCYRIELKYDDGCSNGQLTTDNYYIKEGVGCPAFKDGDGDLNARSNVTNNQIELVSNPVEDMISFRWNEIDATINDFDLMIFDSAGKQVKSQKIRNMGHEVELQFDVPKGIYFYNIKINNESHTGKIVKM